MADTQILDSTKKLLGIDSEYDVFDPEILVHINSVFSTLTQLGVGPDDGFYVDENTTWSMFLGADNRINSVKTYVYLKVRLLFDPPTTSFAIDSFKKQAEELEWRLNVVVDTREGVQVVNPT